MRPKAPGWGGIQRSCQERTNSGLPSHQGSGTPCSGLCILKDQGVTARACASSDPASILLLSSTEGEKNTPPQRRGQRANWTDLNDRDGPFLPGIPEETSVVIPSYLKALAFFTLLQGSGLSGIGETKVKDKSHLRLRGPHATSQASQDI